MLANIRAENFALMDRVELDLKPGLNVITGETGAGKSIIIDAVELALGGRASGDLIRSGADETIIELVFQLKDKGELVSKVPLESGVLKLSREINRNGRSVAKVNGKVVPLSGVKDLASLLVDIHGQHEHQSLLKVQKHLDVLDAFGGEPLIQLRNKVGVLYNKLQAIQRELRSLWVDEKEKARRIDLLEFQADEIDSAQLSPGEDLVLKRERAMLLNAENLYNVISHIYTMLYTGKGMNGSVLDNLSAALSELRSLTKIDDKLGVFAQGIEAAIYELEEVTMGLRDYRERIEFNPGRLQEVDSRLNLIESLKRKYGDTIEEILAFRAKVAAELEYMANSDAKQRSLSEEIIKIKAELATECLRLSQLRSQTSILLEQAVETELASLGMEDSRFQVDITQEEDPEGLPMDRPLAFGPNGIDHVEFLFSANRGESPRSLARVASGGELSRIMLALKKIAATSDDVPVVIFDEIDSGIGGKVAQAVADKLSQIARDRQVICVTHLPQIAAVADAHFVVQKEFSPNRTVTTVRLIEGQDRIKELARMLSGDEESELSLRHVEELLQRASRIKNG